MVYVIALAVDVVLMLKRLGGYSQNFLSKFVKISVTLGLNILSFYKANQILVKFDVVYYKSNKMPIFNV
jgi:hypothetical protein